MILGFPWSKSKKILIAASFFMLINLNTRQCSNIEEVVVDHKMGLLDANTKDVKLDFIFTNSSGLNNAFYCEDKPYERASKDNEKTRHLREQALNYWVSLLPYNECTEHINAVTY